MSFYPDPGDEVPLLLRVGQDLSGDRLPYINDWFSDYRVVAPSGSRPVAGLMGDDPAGSFVVTEPGVHVIGYRSTRDFVELEPGKFHSYLEDEGLERVIEMRAARGDADRSAREYYSRCAKSLIEAGADASGEAFSTILGYTLELIPVENPYATGSGGQLAAAAAISRRADRRCAGAGVHRCGARTQGLGTHRYTGAGHPAPGSARAVARQGRAHDRGATGRRPGADWESFWASLTFHLPDRD